MKYLYSVFIFVAYTSFSTPYAQHFVFEPPIVQQEQVIITRHSYPQFVPIRIGRDSISAGGSYYRPLYSSPFHSFTSAIRLPFTGWFNY